MTNRIIDADALLEWVNKNKYPFTDEGTPLNLHYIYNEDLMAKIKELAVHAPAPEPQTQESIFDADGWCDDFTNAPDEYIAHNGCRIAWVSGDTITPLGDIFAFDEEYFRISMEAWRPMPNMPTTYK